MQIIAVFINHTQSVCITVCGNAQITVIIHHITRQRFQRICAVGRHPAAKESIMLLMEHIHITAAGQQDGSQTALADAIHRVNGYPQAGMFDFLHIHNLQNAVNVVIEGKTFPDES